LNVGTPEILEIGSDLNVGSNLKFEFQVKSTS
jgi:hypothetical protein